MARFHYELLEVLSVSVAAELLSSRKTEILQGSIILPIAASMAASARLAAPRRAELHASIVEVKIDRSLRQSERLGYLTLVSCRGRPI
jgi:hypothetical protein